MAVAKNHRQCLQCGKSTTSAVLCFRCYRSSDAGKAELRMQTLLNKYKPLPDGGECQHCVHWYRRCTLGFPEGGTALAQLCAVRELDSLLE